MAIIQNRFLIASSLAWARTFLMYNYKWEWKPIVYDNLWEDAFGLHVRLITDLKILRDLSPMVLYTIPEMNPLSTTDSGIMAYLSANHRENKIRRLSYKNQRN